MCIMISSLKVVYSLFPDLVAKLINKHDTTKLFYYYLVGTFFPWAVFFSFATCFCEWQKYLFPTVNSSCSNYDCRNVRLRVRTLGPASAHSRACECALIFTRLYAL